jgi:hypothetical protein
VESPHPYRTHDDHTLISVVIDPSAPVTTVSGLRMSQFARSAARHTWMRTAEVGSNPPPATVTLWKSASPSLAEAVSETDDGGGWSGASGSKRRSSRATAAGSSARDRLRVASR